MHLILLEDKRGKILAFFTHHSSKIKVRKLGLFSLVKRETKESVVFIEESVISYKGHISFQVRFFFLISA